jgi:short-subunit dehydrogenase
LAARILYDDFTMANTQDFNGKWALVTGASSGIGVALARELAKHGAKLILTARRRDRLQTLAAELTAQGSEVHIVTADLNDPAAPGQLYQATEGAGLAVDILINNAGLGLSGTFCQSPIEQELSQVRVNCEAMVRLSRLFVPRMVERRRGWVLVLASTASFQPLPYFATSAASKAFDRLFAVGLAGEVARFGVKVTALCPGPTQSEFFDLAHAGAFKGRYMQPADEVAQIAIKALARGRRTVIPYFGGKFIAFLVRFLPVGLITYFVEKAARPAQKAVQ